MMNETMLKNAQELQRRMEKVQRELANKEIEGYASGGIIKLTLNGKMDPVSLEISKDALADALTPDVLEKLDLTTLEDMILVAFKDAKNKVETYVQDQMSGITGGLDLPKL